jgi:hypothetical protein
MSAVREDMDLFLVLFVKLVIVRTEVGGEEGEGEGEIFD